jgi:hypothetical protein
MFMQKTFNYYIFHFTLADRHCRDSNVFVTVVHLFFHSIWSSYCSNKSFNNHIQYLRKKYQQVSNSMVCRLTQKRSTLGALGKYGLVLGVLVIISSIKL